MGSRILSTLLIPLILSIGIAISYPIHSLTQLSIIHKNGTLSGSENWTADNIYLIDDDLTIPNGVTLTINPGVIIKLNIGTKVTVNGSLNAIGTVDQEIYFTSIRDDFVGGDTNGDGFLTSPNKYDWSWLQFSTQSSSNFEYVTLRYSGRECCNYDHAVFLVLGTSIPVIGDHVVLTDNSGNGIEIQGGTLASSLNLPKYDRASYLLTGDLTVPYGATLTLMPGTILKMTDQVRLFINGSLNAVGTQDHQIYFTSSNDDSVGGDTNGNGFSTSPNKNDWGWLEFGNLSSGTIDYATLRFSGHICCHFSHAVFYALNYVIPNIGNHVNLSDNSGNGIELPGATLSKSSTVLPFYPSAAYLLSGDLTVPKGASLSLSEGTVLKVIGNVRILINGTFTSNGSLTYPITITSSRDDSVGGDTNGDGFASSPSVNDWGWIEFNLGSSGNFDFTSIRYSGLICCNFSHGAIYDLSGNVLVNNSTLRDNNIGFETDLVGASYIHNSNIFGNTSMGVANNQVGVWFDATHNYWGHPSGPKDISYADGLRNIDGIGDAVSDYIEYIPWGSMKYPFLSFYLPLVKK